MLIPRFEEVPEQLQDGRQHVLWKLEARPGSSKPAKVPYSPRGYRASATHARSWGTFAQVRAIYPRGYAGIGYVLTGGIVFVDLDHCLDDASGTPSTKALAIIETLASYTERSPSGDGVHIFILGVLPPGSKNRYTYQGLHIEIYEIGRYATLTGHRLLDTPAQVQPRQQALQALVAQWEQATKGPTVTGGQRSRVNSQVPTVTPDPGSLILAGAEGVTTSSLSQASERVGPQRSLEELEKLGAKILAKARGARNASVFEALWDGGDPQYRDDKSAADFDLCLQLLYWCNDDQELATYLYRQSKRIDAKTNRKTTQVGYSYLDVTMYNAAQLRAHRGQKDLKRGTK